MSNYSLTPCLLAPSVSQGGRQQCHLVSGHATLASSRSCLSKLSCAWAVNPAGKGSDITDRLELAHAPSDSSNPPALNRLQYTDRCTSSRTDALDQPWCLILAFVPVDYGRLDLFHLRSCRVINLSYPLAYHQRWTRLVFLREMQGLCSSECTFV